MLLQVILEGIGLGVLLILVCAYSYLLHRKSYS